jgi:hypothetical protein
MSWIVEITVIAIICGVAFLLKVVASLIDARWSKTKNPDKQGKPKEHIMNK